MRYVIDFWLANAALRWAVIALVVLTLAGCDNSDPNSPFYIPLIK